MMFASHRKQAIHRLYASFSKKEKGERVNRRPLQHAILSVILRLFLSAVMTDRKTGKVSGKNIQDTYILPNCKKM